MKAKYSAFIFYENEYGHKDEYVLSGYDTKQRINEGIHKLKLELDYMGYKWISNMIIKIDDNEIKMIQKI